MHRPDALAFIVALSAGLASPLARADDAPPPPVADSLPDIVTLRNGSRFRGTVVELVAGDHVEIVVASGETRRFSMTDVAYAGPVQAAPQSLPPLPPSSPESQPPSSRTRAQAPTTDVDLEADTPGVEFHLKVDPSEIDGTRGSPTPRGFRLLCTAPCTTSLSPGTYRIGLSDGKHRAAMPDDPVTIVGPGTLQGSYTSRKETRIGGWVTLAVADAVGVVLIFDGLLQSAGVDQCPQGQFTCAVVTTPPNMTLIGAGLGVVVVGTLAGLALGLQKDTATITFVPSTPSPVGLRLGPEPSMATAHVDLRGGSLLLRF